jgi:hypothetical protein
MYYLVNNKNIQEVKKLFLCSSIHYTAECQIASLAIKELVKSVWQNLISMYIHRDILNPNNILGNEVCR